MIKLNYDKPTIFKKIRTLKKLTRLEMAKRLKISLGAYHHLEKGNTFPSYGTILEARDKLNLRYEDFTKYYRERDEFIKENIVREDKRLKAKGRIPKSKTHLK